MTRFAARLCRLTGKWPIEAVVDAVRGVKLRTRERITFEYVLLGGVTDRPEDAREVARLVRRTGACGEGEPDCVGIRGRVCRSRVLRTAA